MSTPWLDDPKACRMQSLNSCSHHAAADSTSHITKSKCYKNVCKLLAWREICPRVKHTTKQLWAQTSVSGGDANTTPEMVDAKNALLSWVETQSFRHLSAKYCPLLPPPRSTIAAAFSSDGKTLASTHGDHTVKIIDCQTGNCLKVLSGHRRTPWVVRFHPLIPEILASGSLDHEVRLWDANTADCIGSKDFYRPIASIAFHAQGELLAVASGHKLYIWNYNRHGETSPSIVLKTRRSLRAVHFHPHGAPFLLTAEVNDLDSPDTPLTLATTSGYLQYPPPAIFFTNASSTSLSSAETIVPVAPQASLLPMLLNEDGRTLLYFETRAAGCPNDTQYGDGVTPMELSSGESLNLNQLPESGVNTLLADSVPFSSVSIIDTGDNIPGMPFRNSNQNQTSGSFDAGNGSTFSFSEAALLRSSRQLRPGSRVAPRIHSSIPSSFVDFQMQPRREDAIRQLHQSIHPGDMPRWEFPFLHGWLRGQRGQTQTGTHAALPSSSSIHGSGSQAAWSDTHNMESAGSFGGVTPIRSASRQRSQRSPISSGGSREGYSRLNVLNDTADYHNAAINMESEIARSISSDSSTDLPCTVKLRIWPHDVRNPCNPLDAEKCRLTIPHAVLCSEMGAHFSPCGRFLAACVACVLPHTEVDPGLHSELPQDATEAATSPTRHPISGRRVIYELRIYSLEEATFGAVLASRAIRAAHCLTSIQFSPTSEHLLLAYGRRHGSLLRSCVIDGETKMHIYTILEIYRVSDMELVRVLPSAEDEVNVACFHPVVGCGLVYGTKEGKLRILQYNGSEDYSGTGLNSYENMLEIQQYALEC